jgi:hypothetical protein
VRVSLAFRLFEDVGAAPRRPVDGLKAAVRERLHPVAPDARRPTVGGIEDVRDAA